MNTLSHLVIVGTAALLLWIITTINQNRREASQCGLMGKLGHILAVIFMGLWLFHVLPLVGAYLPVMPWLFRFDGDFSNPTAIMYNLYIVHSDDFTLWYWTNMIGVGGLLCAIIIGGRKRYGNLNVLRHHRSDSMI